MKLAMIQAQHTFAANCYLAASEEGHCAVIDPGAEAEHIIEEIENRHWIPRMILLTHGHFDHVGAVNKLRERYPQLTVYLHEKDLPMVTGDPQAMTPSLRMMIGTLGRRPEEFLVTIDQFFSEGTILSLDELTFTVMETPGHSKGSVCIVCDNVLFSGDTLFHHDVGRTDLFGGSAQELCASIRRLSEIKEDLLICPGHDESSTLAEEQGYFQEFLEQKE